MATYNKYNSDEYKKLLTQNYGTQTNAIEEAYKKNLYDLNTQRPAIKNAYDQARGQTYTNARVSAIGNNEQQANIGLAGNLYSQPKSGYSETSRLYQDVAMQNQLNNLNTEQRSTLQALEQALQNLRTQRDADKATALSGYQTALADESKYAEQTNYNRYQDSIANSLNQQQMDLSRQQFEYGKTQDGLAVNANETARTDAAQAEKITNYYNALSSGFVLSEAEKADYNSYAGKYGYPTAEAVEKLYQDNLKRGTVDYSLIAEHYRNGGQLDETQMAEFEKYLKTAYGESATPDMFLKLNNKFLYDIRKATAQGSGLSEPAKSLLQSFVGEDTTNPLIVEGEYSTLGLSRFVTRIGKDTTADDIDQVLGLLGADGYTFIDAASKNGLITTSNVEIFKKLGEKYGISEAAFDDTIIASVGTNNESVRLTNATIDKTEGKSGQKIKVTLGGKTYKGEYGQNVTSNQLYEGLYKALVSSNFAQDDSGNLYYKDSNDELWILEIEDIKTTGGVPMPFAPRM